MSKTFVEKIADKSPMISMIKKLDTSYDPDIVPFIIFSGGTIQSFRKMYTVRALDSNMSLTSLHDLALEGWPEEIAYDLEKHILEQPKIINDRREIEGYRTGFINWGVFYSGLDPAILQTGRHLSQLDRVDGILARFMGVRCYSCNVKGIHLANLDREAMIGNIKIRVDLNEKERSISLAFSCFAGAINTARWENSENLTYENAQEHNFR